MNAPRPAERGQALPLALAALALSALMLGFLFRSGERLIQRERVRARADVTAFSTGVSYARGLNILSLSQKAAAAGWIATALSGGSLYYWVERIQRVQDGAIEYLPYLTLFTAFQVGGENGLLALPIWNRPVLFGGSSFGSEGYRGLHWRHFKPAYNVAKVGAADAAGKAAAAGLQAAGWDGADAGTITEIGAKTVKTATDALDREQRETLGRLAKKALPNFELDWLTETDRYEYRRKDGRTVKVDKADAGPVMERDGRGGYTQRHKANAKHKHRYVSELKKLKLDLQVSLEDAGPHVITLIAVQRPLPSERRPGWVSAISQAQVAGGNLEMTDLDGAAYGATLVPVRLFDSIGFSSRLKGADQHGFARDIAQEHLDARFSGEMPAAEAGEALLPLLDALPLPGAIRQPLLRAANGLDELLAVQH